MASSKRRARKEVACGGVWRFLRSHWGVRQSTERLEGQTAWYAARAPSRARWASKVESVIPQLRLAGVGSTESKEEEV
ncbi:unnamed protein product [Rangifer tarandus platyrhynchus]|uniref:Uncharacterized protein n=1 Tax=Rangifer tarandus platyrhynchus TaxID=3082113 RepID=A0AC59ZQS1_RANTA